MLSKLYSKEIYQALLGGDGTSTIASWKDIVKLPLQCALKCLFESLYNTQYLSDLKKMYMKSLYLSQDIGIMSMLRNHFNDHGCRRTTDLILQKNAPPCFKRAVRFYHMRHPKDDTFRSIFFLLYRREITLLVHLRHEQVGGLISDCIDCILVLYPIV